jgi:hypothetical protein
MERAVRTGLYRPKLSGKFLRRARQRNNKKRVYSFRRAMHSYGLVACALACNVRGHYFQVAKMCDLV